MSEVFLLDNVAVYVRDLFRILHNPHLLYHNLKHTETVVQRSMEIGNSYHLQNEDLTILSSAAWFHDTGHLFGENNEHEERSVEQLNLFMADYEVSEKMIQAIIGCIRATKIPHHPHGLLEEIICDADTYDLGTLSFPGNDIMLKNEVELRTGRADSDWDSKTLELFLSHVYYTEYCKEHLTARKEANYLWLAERKMKRTNK